MGNPARKLNVSKSNLNNRYIRSFLNKTCSFSTVLSQMSCKKLIIIFCVCIRTTGHQGVLTDAFTRAMVIRIFSVDSFSIFFLPNFYYHIFLYKERFSSSAIYDRNILHVFAKLGKQLNLSNQIWWIQDIMTKIHTRISLNRHFPNLLRNETIAPSWGTQ